MHRSTFQLIKAIISTLYYEMRFPASTGQIRSLLVSLMRFGCLFASKKMLDVAMMSQSLIVLSVRIFDCLTFIK